MQAATLLPFEGSIGGFCRDAMRISARHPRNAIFFARVAQNQRAAARRRARRAAGGTPPPPLIVVDPAGRRVPRHQDGVADEQDPQLGTELGPQELRSLLREAGDRGISIVALTGQQPFARPDVLDVTREFPQMVFPLVADSSLYDDRVVEELRRQPHVLPIFSLRGRESDIGRCGGADVSEGPLAAMNRLSRRGVFFGVSITVTRPNFALVTSRIFVRDLVRRGCRLFFYADHVPDRPDTDALVPSERQRVNQRLALSLLRREFGALFVSASREPDDTNRDTEESLQASGHYLRGVCPRQQYSCRSAGRAAASI